MHHKHQHAFSNQIWLATKLQYRMSMKIQTKELSGGQIQDPSREQGDSKLWLTKSR